MAKNYVYIVFEGNVPYNNKVYKTKKEAQEVCEKIWERYAEAYDNTVENIKKHFGKINRVEKFEF